MYCRNCGKQISNISNECAYCKTKVNVNNNQNNYQEKPKNNNVLYYGMNGKPVTIWKFILGLILIIGGVWLGISMAISLGINW